MTDPELSRLFLAIVTLLVAALTVGYLFDRLGLPRVVGEIMGGLALGPSMLGGLFPEIHGWLFEAAGKQGTALDVLYWIGLVLLLFTSGFRIQRNLSRDDRNTILVVLVAATALPFGLGFAAPVLFDLSFLIGTAGNTLAFQLVMGVAVAVTSIPVISKIFIDLGIIETRFAKIVLGCATLQDLVLWTVLAIATGLIADGVPATTSEISLLQAGKTAAITLGFLAVSLWLAPLLLKALDGTRINIISRSSPTGYTLAICFIFAALAAALGINAIFGAFVAGIAVGALPDETFFEVKRRIADVSLAFFVPIYFALVGLKIDLTRFLDPMFTANFIVLTTMVELGAVILAARLIGKTPLTSFNLGMAMNTRGGPGIVLASVALSFGIINGVFFVTLVLAAVITSLASGAWFRLLLRRGLPLYN